MAAYLLLGARSFSRARGLLLWRLLRAPVTALGALLPVAVGGVFLWLYAMPSSGRADILGDRTSIRGLIEGTGFEMSRGVWMVMLAVGAALVVGRAAVDAMIFGSYRTTWLKEGESLGKRLRRTCVPFVGVAMLHLGLLVGGTMFLSPIVDVLLRMLLRHADQPGVSFAMFGLAVVCVLTIAWLRFFTMVIAGHVVWRPTFFVGTITSALSAPITQRRSYAPLLILWMSAFSGWVVMASIAAAPIVGTWAVGGNPAIRDGVLLGLIVSAGFIATAWFDAVLVGLVGHRLGDVGGARLPEAPPAGELPQVSIRMAPFGAFPLGPHEAYTQTPPFVRTFRELLGHEIVLDPFEQWSLPVSGVVATGEHQNAAGGRELSVAAHDAEPASVDGGAKSRRLTDLQKHLGRAVHRTDAGGREVVFEG
jgi:hypothetical protein